MVGVVLEGVAGLRVGEHRQALSIEHQPGQHRVQGAQLLELREQSQPRVVGGYCRAACAESLLSGITSFHALLGAHWSGP